jgi:Gpi18-like mannosyltransferase
LVIASTVAKVVSLKNPQLWKYSFITVLMFPSVLFNGSFWGQCDVIYSSFVLITLLGILTKKYLRSLLFYGIALSFKFQAIFFLPVFWFLYLFKKIKLSLLGLLGFSSILIYGLSVLPAYLVGRPLLDEIGKNNGLLTIYFNQGKVYGGLVMGAIPNLYQWIDNSKYEYFYQGGVWITLIILGILSLVFVKQKSSTISNETIVKLSYLTTLAVPYFLPKMHERYMFLADIMCLVYVFWFPKRLWIGIITGFISYSIYIKHIIGGSVPQFLEPQFNSIYLFGIMAFVLWDILQDFKIKQTVSNV